MSVPNDLDPMDEELLAVEALVLPTEENGSEVMAEGAVVDAPVNSFASSSPHSPTTNAHQPPRTPTTPATPPSHGSGADRTVTSTEAQSSSGFIPLANSSATTTTPIRNSSQAMVNYIKAKETQTPTKQSSDVVYDAETSDVVKRIIEAELGDDIPEVGISWLRAVYQNVASPAQVKDYLETSGFYEGKRWVNIPEVAESEGVLYAPFCAIINSILETFGLSGPTGNVRKAIDTHVKHLMHGGPKTIKNFSSPDISIKASGPSFRRPLGTSSIGFENTAAIFDGKRDCDVNNDSKHISQFGNYARQTFMHQPNRRYVRSMVVTERQARVYHFDRSGAQYTELFDIHLNPRLFVRLVIGLCTTDERLLGLDDTVQWTVAPTGLRAGGTLRTVRRDGTPVTYTLSESEQPWYRSSIRGRGIVCWPEGRTPEYTLLEALKDIPGVCQMLSYEIRRDQTKHFRGKTCTFSKEAFHNCIAFRLILKAYGTSINNFSSREEMLAALRDAIAAHKNVLNKGLLHRDICHNNVLIGIQGIQAALGERGILMDFDMSSGPLTGKSISDISEGFKSGILLFQSTVLAKSVAILADESDKRSSTTCVTEVGVPTHDYHDELESFFWLFCYLVFTHNPTGGEGPKTPIHAYLHRMMIKPAEAAHAKVDMLQSDFVLGEAMISLSEGWREIGCYELFLEWREISLAAHSKRAKLFYSKPEPLEDGTVPNRFAKVIDLEDVDGLYERILGLIDVALRKALERATPLNRPVVVRPRAKSLRLIESDPNAGKAPEASGSGSSHLKRSAVEVDDAEESPTKPKRACPPGRSAGPSTLSQSIVYVVDSDGVV
ncbi:hypothetical protein MD484_g6113, partial [Candolleomyces efflorescens]